VTDPGHIERLWRSSDLFHHAVHRFPVPVIAAVDGIAYGGGFDLAVLCDLRIATHRATFAHPEAALGPVVYGPLHDLVGGAIARELVLTGREVDAPEALRLHLVTEVTDPSGLTERAREVSRAPRDVLRGARRSSQPVRLSRRGRQHSTCSHGQPTASSQPGRQGDQPRKDEAFAKGYCGAADRRPLSALQRSRTRPP
jgi:enoyl-CoA hydratase/carnithine racemase